MAFVRVLICLAALQLVFKLAAAVEHTVGGPGGWALGTDFATWASSQTFLVGDKLLFKYGLIHSVMEVEKADYDNCQTSKPIATYFDGSTTITLTTPGKRYFICATPGHCSGGMKLQVDTLSPPPSPPPTSPPPRPPPPSSPPPPTRPPPKAPSTPPPQLPISPPPKTPSNPPPPPKPQSSPPPPPVSSTSPPPESPASPITPARSPLPETTPPPTAAPPKSSGSRPSVFSMLGWFLIGILTLQLAGHIE